MLELLHVSDGPGPHAAGRRSNGTSSVCLLYHDYRVIAALLRKNKAQHRVGRWWQRLEGVRRSLRNVLETTSRSPAGADGGEDHGETNDGQTNDGTDGTLPTIHSASSSFVLGFLHALESASQPVMTHQERQVPSRCFCLAVTVVLYQRLRQLERLLERAYAAAQACSAQLAHTFFMPLSLSGLSLAGRVYAIGVQLLREGVALYNVVRGEVMDMLPTSGRLAGHEEAGADVASPVPPMELRCQMKEGELVRVVVITGGHGSLLSTLSPPVSSPPVSSPPVSSPPVSSPPVSSPPVSSPPVPAGLQVLGSDVRATEPHARVPAGLVVEEDHGQVVSRDEVYAALGLNMDTGANIHTSDIAPIFEESAVRIEEGVGGAEKGSRAIKRPRVAEGKDGNKAVAAGEPCPAKTTTTATILTRGTGQVPASQPNVQFIRVGSNHPPPAVKPLITRLEEEKKRKRKKKKKVVQDDQGNKKPSPWDDLFT